MSRAEYRDRKERQNKYALGIIKNNVDRISTKFEEIFDETYYEATPFDKFDVEESNGKFIITSTNYGLTLFVKDDIIVGIGYVYEVENIEFSHDYLAVVAGHEGVLIYDFEKNLITEINY